MTDIDRLIAWCRSHDWGRHAEIIHIAGEPYVAGLDEHYVQGGVSCHRAVTLPAVPHIIRRWAGY